MRRFLEKRPELQKRLEEVRQLLDVGQQLASFPEDVRAAIAPPIIQQLDSEDQELVEVIRLVRAIKLAETISRLVDGRRREDDLVASLNQLKTLLSTLNELRQAFGSDRPTGELQRYIEELRGLIDEAYRAGLRAGEVRGEIRSEAKSLLAEIGGRAVERLFDIVIMAMERAAQQEKAQRRARRAAVDVGTVRRKRQ